MPRPNRDALAEMIAEAERALRPDEEPLLPATYDWHRDIFRACGWGR